MTKKAAKPHRRTEQLSEPRDKLASLQRARLSPKQKIQRTRFWERAKFLAIFESNLDEFYMVRVSGFIDQRDNGIIELTPDGLTPTAQLQLIREYAQPLRKRAFSLPSRPAERTRRRRSHHSQVRRP